MDDDVRQVVEQIHAAPAQAVVAVSGAGGQALVCEINSSQPVAGRDDNGPAIGVLHAPALALLLLLLSQNRRRDRGESRGGEERAA